MNEELKSWGTVAREKTVDIIFQGLERVGVQEQRRKKKKGRPCGGSSGAPALLVAGTQISQKA